MLPFTVRPSASLQFSKSKRNPYAAKPPTVFAASVGSFWMSFIDSR